MQETWVQPPGWEDPLEKGMTNCSSTLAWETPWTVELGGLLSMRLQRVGHNEATKNNTQYIILRLVPNRKRTTSRLYIVTLLI